jgi:hypothetical protein
VEIQNSSVYRSVLAELLEVTSPTHRTSEVGLEH